MQSESALKPIPAPHILYEPLGQSEIRVLEIQPGSFDDPICCAMSLGSLDDNISYNALSYVWGDAALGFPIKVNDQHFTVTENLESALRHIRDADKAQVLWVDAISINQRNLAELSAQVQMMRRIYEQANTVIIWLGPADFSHSVVNTSNAFDALKKLAGWHNKSIACGKPNSLAWRKALSGEDFTALVPMMESRVPVLPLRSSYWGRLWVIQEAVLAKNLIVLNGPHLLSFDDMYNAIVYFINSLPSMEPLLRRMIGISRIKLYRDMMARKECLPLGQLLQEICHVATTDPRDKVYSLLGLADDGGEIIPDYTLSVEDVYIAAAKHVASRGDLTLMTFKAGGDNKIPGLPSWVSDWRIVNQESQHPIAYRSEGYPHHASATLGMELEFSDKDHIMIIRGALVDDIDICGMVMDVKVCSHFDVLYQWETVMLQRFGDNHVQNDFNDGDEPIRAIPRSNDPDEPTPKEAMERCPSPKHKITDIRAHWHTRTVTANGSWPPGRSIYASRPCGSWSMFRQENSASGIAGKQMAQRIQDHSLDIQESYFGGGDLTEAYCRTLLLDLDPLTGEKFTSETLNMFYDCHVPEANESMGRLDTYELRRMRMLKESEEFDSSLASSVTNRRLFITTKGYIGLGPKQMQKDDKVCVLFGSSVPFVMRPCGSYWNLIGECYTHGIMDGEIATHIKLGQLDSQLFQIS